jgi:hypothetical protein
VGPIADLRRAIRCIRRRTTITQLAQRGVRELKVLKLSEVVQLFSDMHRSYEQLEQQQRNRDEVEQLRKELEASRQELELQLARENARRAERVSQSEELMAKVQALFADPAAAGDLQSRVLALMTEVVDREREAVTVAQRTEHERTVDLLERRIRKLMTHLDEAERELALAAQRNSVDPGIASIYRVVQGLAGTDEIAARKRELMADLFRANLRLRLLAQAS